MGPQSVGSALPRYILSKRGQMNRRFNQTTGLLCFNRSLGDGNCVNNPKSKVSTSTFCFSCFGVWSIWLIVAISGSAASSTSNAHTFLTASWKSSLSAACSSSVAFLQARARASATSKTEHLLYDSAMSWWREATFKATARRHTKDSNSASDKLLSAPLMHQTFKEKFSKSELCVCVRWNLEKCEWNSASWHLCTKRSMLFHRSKLWNAVYIKSLGEKAASRSSAAGNSFKSPEACDRFCWSVTNFRGGKKRFQGHSLWKLFIVHLPKKWVFLSLNHTLTFRLHSQPRDLPRSIQVLPMALEWLCSNISWHCFFHASLVHACWSTSHILTPLEWRCRPCKHTESRCPSRRQAANKCSTNQELSSLLSYSSETTPQLDNWLQTVLRPCPVWTESRTNSWWTR